MKKWRSHHDDDDDESMMWMVSIMVIFVWISMHYLFILPSEIFLKCNFRLLMVLLCYTVDTNITKAMLYGSGTNKIYI